MSRNGAGTFAVINPVLVGTLRSSANVNENFEDAGDELTNSLPINGEAGMTGQLRVTDGSLTDPGISWDSDTNTGFRRTGTDAMAWVGGGVDRATMDENGKLALLGALSVAGGLARVSGTLPPLTLQGSGSRILGLRNSGNDTDEHVIASYRAGDGSGAKGELRMVGGGANDVATLRFYLNDALVFQWTGALFTHSTDVAFGASGIKADADGFLEFTEIATPSAPASNVVRAYAKDVSGTTRLFYQRSDGIELPWQPPIDRQIFTANGTWTKPAQGQTVALVECWGAGGSGAFDSVASGGGGGGGAARQLFLLSDLPNSVSVSVGSGGASVSSFGEGNTGGNTTFNTVVAWGGGGGSQVGGTDGAGGGGGGVQSAGSIGTGSAGGAGGGLLGAFGAGFMGAADNANPFGGAGGGGPTVDGGVSIFGGGSGAGGTSGQPGRDGGSSIFGGGGGASAVVGQAGGDGGASIFGGSGGGTAVAGTAPGGGGGGGLGASPSGAGARGEVRVTCW